MEIKLSSVNDALQLSQYYLNNVEHLKRWEPVKDNNYHELESWKHRLMQREVDQKEKTAAYFSAYDESTKEIIATCNLTGITLGAFRACYMGYSVSELYQGKGKMKQLCSYVIQYAFDELQLNRIMSNYMPNNIKSENLLTGLGFEVEGKAKKYLFINGQWQDHILSSLLNPENAIVK
jgi:ribosomal-protein-alanine N-acetyltransferase